MSTFEYNAPQFVDFNAGVDNDDSDDSDTFFDVENEESSKTSENKENEPDTTTALVEKKDETQPKISPATDKIKPELQKTSKQMSSPKELEPSSPKKRDIKKGVRRLSADMRVALGKDFSENTLMKLDKLSLKDKRYTIYEEIPINKLGEKLHPMTTRKDTTTRTSQPDLSRVIKENESRKRKATSRTSEMPKKFIGLAEHTLHFQKDTPPRFHSSRRRSSGSRKNLFKARMSYKPQKTLAVTPKLMTAFRHRPSVVPSKEEREKLELEEMKKHQVKALPLNEKILQPPKPLQKSEKQPTVQEPFKLTQVFKKPAPVKESAYVFTANPVPRGLLEKTLEFPPKVKLLQNATNKSASGYKPPVRVQAFTNDNNVTVEEVFATGVPIRKVTRPRNTEVKPFSFEERELEKKERKKQEQLEETKQTFRARSPRVLRKSPFKPMLDHQHSQPHELILNTERRIQERRQFEIQQQIKEEKIAYEKEQMALEKARKEEEEIARLRQEAVHKARPMPIFKPPIKLENSIPLTEPKSPRFSKRTRTIKTPY